MTDKRPGLVLHLTGIPQPLHIALDIDEAGSLRQKLPELMAGGETKTLSTADGGSFVVNFAHVATAHVESTRSDANAYGAPARGAGFGT